MKFTILGALGVMTLAHGAHAMEVTGGTAEIGYSTLSDNTSASTSKFTGGLEGRVYPYICAAIRSGFLQL